MRFPVDSTPKPSSRRTKQRTVKSSKGSGVVSKVFVLNKRKLQNRPSDPLMFSALPKPNMSRRPPSSILYAFPHFDKCDSLLYFPSTFTRLLNTCDMPALSKLFSTHLDKNCDIDYCFPSNCTPQGLLKTYEVLNELQPDRIMVVHSTKVVENRIEASVHMKFTDCKFIYDSVVRSAKKALVGCHMISQDRTENIIHKLNMQERPEELQKRYIDLAKSEVDLVVYVHINMVLTFDDFSKKVTALGFRGRMTSMHAASDDL